MARRAFDRQAPMGLSFKFNLVLLAVFLAGFAVAGYISHDLLHRQARERVLGEARLVMEAALAIRGYTVGQVKPHLIDRMESTFLPQTIPAYAATETLAELHKKYPDYPAEMMVHRIVRDPPSAATIKPELPSFAVRLCAHLLELKPAHRPSRLRKRWYVPSTCAA